MISEDNTFVNGGTLEQSIGIKCWKLWDSFLYSIPDNIPVDDVYGFTEVSTFTESVQAGVIFHNEV